MKSHSISYLKVSLLFLALIFVSSKEVVSAQKNEKTAMNEELLFTTGEWNDVLSKAKKSGKYIFVDAYATWCGPCKKLKSTTFKEQEVISYFNENFINFSIDTEKGSGIMLSKKWEVLMYPTLLFFDSNGKLLFKHEGFVDGNKLIELGKQAKLLNK